MSHKRGDISHCRHPDSFGHMEGRGSLERQCERSQIAKLTQMKSKVNRLKRSPKSATPKPGQNRNTVEFKTPTRPARGQFRRLIPEDSPSNDPDCHQDIIWDTTSPSPIRHGRGQRRAANVRAVDISDIANRIAPKSGRLEEADSSLLQWIGDSAVPCTPEVQQHRVKPVSTKQSTVDDLMRLAKQFDFNMRQDEAQEQKSDAATRCDVKQEPTHSDRFTAAHNTSAFRTSAIQPVDDRGLQQDMDDDLDVLFDGPTQQLSGRLSQPASYSTQHVPQRNIDTRKASDSQNGFSLSTKPNHGHTEANNAADDDWSSDGLLDDSLLLEMTQNPDLFATPQSSSTQKHDIRNAFGAANKPQEATNEGIFHRQNTKGEQTFQMDSGTPVKPYGALSGTGNQMKNMFFPVPKASPDPKHCFNANQNQRYQTKTQVHQLQVVELNTGSSTQHFQPNTKQMESSSAKPSCSKPPSMPHDTNSAGVKPREEDVSTGRDVLDEDLDSFFASDDIWDDEDDDLFCEACDNVEEESTSTTKAPRMETASQKTVFAHPYPPKMPTANVSMSSANTSASQYGLNSGSNVSCDTSRPSGPSSNGPYRFKPVKSSSLVGRPGHERGVLAVLQSDVSASENQQFKKPHSDSFRTAPVLTKDVCDTSVVRCSDAEIERKKQQAMERRRLRMMANQNLRAPV